MIAWANPVYWFFMLEPPDWLLWFENDVANRALYVVVLASGVTFGMLAVLWLKG